MELRYLIILCSLEVVFGYRVAEIPSIGQRYRYRGDNTTDQPPPSQVNCSLADRANFLQCYQLYLSNYGLSVTNLNGPNGTLPNIQYLIDGIRKKSYDDNQKIYQAFQKCYSTVSIYCLYFKTLQQITLNLVEAEEYTGELSISEMVFKNQDAEKAIRCYGNASIVCEPDNLGDMNTLPCSEADRFVRCNLWVYDDTGCDSNWRTDVCDVIVTDAQRFGIIDQSCTGQLFQSCLKMTNSTSSTTPSSSNGNKGGSNFGIKKSSDLFSIVLGLMLLFFMK